MRYLFGAISMLENGCVGSGCTNVRETYDYNPRLQPARIQLGTASDHSQNSCLVYNYYAESNPTSCAVPALDRATVAACPIQIDYVRLPEGYRG